MVVGVTNGYEKVLEVNGVGYRASKSGNKLTLNLGYSHPVEMIDPEGVETVLEALLQEFLLDLLQSLHCLLQLPQLLLLELQLAVFRYVTYLFPP